MSISGIFGKNNISKIDINIELPAEIYADMEFPLKIRLANRRKLLPAFLIDVNAAGGRVLFPYVGAGEEAITYLKVSFKQRGRNRFSDIYTSSIFPFNFFVRYGKADKMQDIIVFPKPKKCELWSMFEKEGRQKGERHSDKTGYDGEITSFRDYIQGDPVKYVYWKASAKTGELKTKELSSLSRRPVTIDFERVGIRNKEEKISCVTYAVLKLLRQNIPVGLKIGGTLFKAGLRTPHKIIMLKELALYGKE